MTSCCRLVLAPLCVVTTAAAAQARPGGSVTDSATGLPLAGVRVVALRLARTSLTDAGGRFVLPQGAAGGDTLTFARIGYAPRRVAWPGDTVTVSLAAIGVPLDPVVVTASRREEPAFAAPAPMTVLERATLDSRPALTAVEHLRTAPGLDVAAKGLVQHTYSARGDRGSNSGVLLTLVDHRQAMIPSLGFNVSYMFPLADGDIERIELMRGPGAALYGPGADRGVLHVLTRSPFEARGTQLSLTGGSRELLQIAARWAAPVSGRVAAKLSADYLRGRDWQFRDSTEQARRAAGIAAGADPDTLRIGRREPVVQRVATEARIDWRPDARTELVTTLGVSQALRAVELAGDVGAAQVRDWRYTAVQSRLRRGGLLLNATYSASNTGDSYVLRTGAPITDGSRMVAAQGQQALSAGPVALLAGSDVRFTEPRTFGTIHGANESRDDVTESGAYLHATTAVGRRLELTAALRADHHNVLDDAVLSPRAGIVYRPTARQALRLTYNRAFTSPSANMLFLDIETGAIGPHTVRAGSIPAGGYRIRRDCGGPCMRSAFDPGGSYLAPDATLVWPALAALSPVDLAGVPAPSAADIPTAIWQLDPVRETLVPGSLASVADIAPLRRTTTSTLEAGWKLRWGQAGVLDLDLYTTRVTDPVGNRYSPTPLLMLDGAATAAYLSNHGIAAADAQAAAQVLAQIPAGVIPADPGHPTDVLVISRQGGAYRLWGADLSVQLPLSRSLTASGYLSLVSDDSLADVAEVAPVVLGVPRTKAAAGLRWRNESRALELGGDARYVRSFPVASGAFVARVATYAVVDVRARQALPGAVSPTLTVEVQNLLDRRHQEFAGAPYLGRLVLMRLQFQIR